MINSNVKEEKKGIAAFPKLMQSLSTGSIVLVDSNKHAVIVHKGDGQYAGTVGTTFSISVVGEDNWKDFDGEVTLSNKKG